ncbi:MAG TPA: HlyD family efflux transporter periplasmic adaptor subunit [Vicinamibacterales bacterium]
MTRWTFAIAAALVVLTIVNIGMLSGGESPPDPPSAQKPSPARDLVAGPGVVEPISEELRVLAQIGGRLDRVLVDEGDRVTTGQVLAVIDDRDYRARVFSTEAELALRQAELRRVRNGARPEERKEAAALLAEAEAVLRNARTDRERRERLLSERVISRTEADDARRAEQVASARVEAARQRLEVMMAGAREEDLARADAAVDLARGRLEDARAQLAKTVIRAPFDGIVLRRYRQKGESVSTEFDSPIVTIGDDRVRRVRVDVDEADVAGIATGQRAWVTADAFGDRRFPGRVTRVGKLLGRKNLRTDEPTERLDTKVLETLIDLDDGHELPLGLRVQAFIVVR